MSKKSKKRRATPTVEKVNSTNSFEVGTTSVKSSMKEKAEPVMKVEEYPEEKRSVFGTIIKLLFLFLFLIGVIFLIAFGINRIFPSKNMDLPTPIIEKEIEAREINTNDQDLKVYMEIPDKKDEDKYEIFVYINGKREQKAVKENSDSHEYIFSKSLKSEGEYEITAKVLKKGLLWQVGPESESFKVNFDATVPSSDISLDYEKEPTDSDGKIDLKGVVEPYSKVTIKNDAREYSTQADENGNFEIKDIELDKGENSYIVYIEDKAGNIVTATKRMVVSYGVGDLNGDGASTNAGSNGNGSTLPKSAGELTMFKELFAMKGFVLFAILFGLLTFLASSAFFSAKLVSKK